MNENLNMDNQEKQNDSSIQILTSSLQNDIVDTSVSQPVQVQIIEPTKFCKHCGGKVPKDAIICTLCGRQIEDLQKNDLQPQILINNTNTTDSTNINNNNIHIGNPKDKVVALLLCFFLGVLGAHKFYEGKIGMGILYLFTMGLFGIGYLIDIFVILGKPDPYEV